MHSVAFISLLIFFELEPVRCINIDFPGTPAGAASAVPGTPSGRASAIPGTPISGTQTRFGRSVTGAATPCGMMDSAAALGPEGTKLKVPSMENYRNELVDHDSSDDEYGPKKWRDLDGENVDEFTTLPPTAAETAALLGDFESAILQAGFGKNNSEVVPEFYRNLYNPPKAQADLEKEKSGSVSQTKAVEASYPMAFELDPDTPGQEDGPKIWPQVRRPDPEVDRDPDQEIEELTKQILKVCDEIDKVEEGGMTGECKDIALRNLLEERAFLCKDLEDIRSVARPKMAKTDPEASAEFLQQSMPDLTRLVALLFSVSFIAGTVGMLLSKLQGALMVSEEVLLSV
eukprot:gnl/MRDRNA2_/MRDRNA2_193311_c0_seq1.p1 gnl/MRDRNA2_/MRDRNA2_193311_c0~~gnl/MRDRNA2_/MRDRNA2_193311_c0_seq1.p1  ORF type:complete len:345 (+),score=65.82 gnl/MRDRNA2_/MRDRNA2_193311_c0_seq1:37-1071(+)